MKFGLMVQLDGTGVGLNSVCGNLSTIGIKPRIDLLPYFVSIGVAQPNARKRYKRNKERGAVR